MAKIIDGKKLARQKEKELTKRVAEFRKKFGLAPELVAIMVGDDPASKRYLEAKKKAARRVGILFQEKRFATDVDPDKVIKFIKTANKDSSVHGVMVQLPLPKKLEIGNWKLKILGAIAPRKDVDCLTPENLDLLATGKSRFLPPTVKGIMEILKETARNDFFAHECKNFKNFPDASVGEFRHRFAQKDYFAVSHALKDKEIVIVGAGDLVGKPLAMYLKNLGATVTVCDEFTKNLSRHTQKAEIIISATGVPGLIKKKMVRKGTVVIDVGAPKPEVDFNKVKEVAFAITPVPGGVGPLTVIYLLENTLLAAQG